MSANRKEALKALFTPPPSAPPAEATAEKGTPARAGSGAVRSMGLNLQRISADAEAAHALKAQLESGTSVIELDPGDVEPSFISDRLDPEDDPAFQALVDSIAEHGQQVPILVRKHPEKPGRYQAAYGHRRLRAVAQIGRKVRALLRALDDRALVVAQGKENGERRNLSFIERARFALTLEERGFDRATVIAALAVDRAEATRLLGVARAVPEGVVRFLGPASKAGRPRWMALSQRLGTARAMATVQAFLADPASRTLDSDARFNRLFYLLSSPVGRDDRGSVWKDRGGRPVVRIEKGPTRTKLSVDERLAPAFGAFLVGKLDQLYAEFESAGRGGAGE